MTIYVTFDKDGYVNGWSKSRSSDGELEVFVSDLHEVFHNPRVFKYADGDLVKDEERQKQLLEDQEKEENKPTPDEINEMALLELAMIVSELKGGN